jgi:hypothetical protein
MGASPLDSFPKYAAAGAAAITLIRVLRRRKAAAAAVSYYLFCTFVQSIVSAPLRVIRSGRRSSGSS